jgi:hypothetical protein
MRALKEALEGSRYESGLSLRRLGEVQVGIRAELKKTLENTRKESGLS